MRRGGERKDGWSLGSRMRLGPEHGRHSHPSPCLAEPGKAHVEPIWHQRTPTKEMRRPLRHASQVDDFCCKRGRLHWSKGDFFRSSRPRL